ncbi:MAG: glycerol kinase GlpK [Trueperaceae bacterium]
MADFILALDQGTTSSRAILFDHQGRPRATAQREFSQHYPRPGWVEHDPEEIWTSQSSVAAEALAQAGAVSADVAAIGITNQRETVLVWERTTGRAIHPAIVWQDRRTAQHIDSLKERGLEDLIQRRTGLVLDAYFSASKLAWILDNVEGARARSRSGELLFGTVDSWLAYRLTGGEHHITDVSNACRTMLFDIDRLEWDDELLAIFDIPRDMLPVVRSSSEVYGEAVLEKGGKPRPLAGIAGDQQAATFGQACFQAGQGKNTYGTGCFMVMNTGARRIESQNRLLSTVAWQQAGAATYALEGSIFIAGAVVQWLRDGLGVIENSAEVEALASTVSDNGGVYLVPAFSGLGAPHWDQYARGAILGLTRGSTKAHLARAALESIAFQVADVVTAMEHDCGSKLSELRVDGGAAHNDLLMQFQADLLGVPVIRPEVVETTALGAAYLAGLAVGFWSDREEIAGQWREEARFEPKLAAAERDVLREDWTRALERSRDWARD